MNALRTYVRAVLSEAVGQVTYQRTDIGRAADKFSGADELNPGGSVLASAVKGMATLGTAAKVMSRTKSGKVAAGWNATKGSRKNVLSAVGALGVVGYAVSQDFASKRSNADAKDDDDERLRAQMAQFHEKLIASLDATQTQMLESFRTPEVRSASSDQMTPDKAKALLTNFKANYTKYVGDYTRKGSVPLNNRYADVFMGSTETGSAKGRLESIIKDTAANTKEFDEAGLRYYASCVMQIYEAQLIVAAMTEDLAVIPDEITDKKTFQAASDQFKTRIDSTKALKEALDVTSGME
jgi:hypothetical protein